MDDLKILLKLQRKYTKHEIVAYQAQEIKNLQIEIGILKSTISELEDSIESKEEIKLSKTKGWADNLESDRITELLHQVRSLQKALEFEKKSDYKKEMIVWRDKFISLSAKQDIKI
jgi:ATP-dependent helicase/DNAse subunit B